MGASGRGVWYVHSRPLCGSRAGCDARLIPDNAAPPSIPANEFGQNFIFKIASELLPLPNSHLRQAKPLPQSRETYRKPPLSELQTIFTMGFADLVSDASRRSRSPRTSCSPWSFTQKCSSVLSTKSIASSGGHDFQTLTIGVMNSIKN